MYDYNPLYNPILQYMQQQPQQPRREVIKVNGENGARALSMGPNSSELALDVSGELVWLITTDGAGYKTVAPFDIRPHTAAPAPDLTGLETRIAKLEAWINEHTNNSANAQRSEPGQSSGQSRADQRDRR